MTDRHVYRNDIYARAESGPEWLQDFIQSIYKQSPEHKVLKNIQDKRGENVKDVVEDYRKAIGLDMVKSASVKSPSISKRATENGEDNKSNVFVVIEEDPKIKKDLHSMCEHSGGHKSTHTLIHYLREKLGPELVQHSNEDLKNYIEDLKSEFKSGQEDEALDYNLGEVGTEGKEYFDDMTADYAKTGE